MRARLRSGLEGGRELTDLLVDHKWFLLMGAEVVFWVCAAAFFLTRYWFEMGRLGNLFLVMIVAEEVLANLFILGLGALDYRQAGKITGYQVAIVAFVLYALTLGRHDARRLDAFLKGKVAQWKGRDVPTTVSASSEPAHSTPHDKATRYRREWYEHLALFVAGQTILLVIGESWPAALVSEGVPSEPDGLMTASRVWTVVFLVDTVWSLSYTVWPAKEKA